MADGITYRAGKEHLAQVKAFLDREIFLHRHLDWRSPLDWLGCQPYWLLEQGHEITAALACPDEPTGIHWVRLFASAYPPITPHDAWVLLFTAVLRDLQARKNALVAALALSPWFDEILKTNQFTHLHDIVVMEWRGLMPAALQMPVEIHLRKMREEDLPGVELLDRISFNPLWQNPFESLRVAFLQAGYATVAVSGDSILGYQISTQSIYGMHLARLAVHPEARRSNIGYNMVHDLQAFALKSQSSLVSVNTQSDNNASLALYQKLGFEKTGENLPVYILKVVGE